MIENNRLLNIACHAILISGALLVCVPLYFTYVAASLTMQELQQVPFPVLPGGALGENLAAAWQSENFSRIFLNTWIVTTGIVFGKISISLLAAFALVYFRFRFRLTIFWLIFISLMLPLEVRIRAHL